MMVTRQAELELEKGVSIKRQSLWEVRWIRGGTGFQNREPAGPLEG